MVSSCFQVGDRDDPTENPFDKDRAEQRLLKARQKMREARTRKLGLH